MRTLQTAFLVVLALAMSAAASLRAQSASTNSSNAEGVLKASEIAATSLFPDRVFYRGKTATVQLRNTGGVRFADGFCFLAGLVDTAGYSTAVAEKYQAYLLAEVPLQFEGRELRPGAYGGGFVNGEFVVTDLGAHDLFQVPAKRDTEMKRPIPLQVTTGSSEGIYRLYRGRDFVEFRRAR